MRIRVLASLAVPGLAAVVHGIVLSTAAGSERALKLQWIFWTLGLNISGAVFYVSQVSLVPSFVLPSYTPVRKVGDFLFSCGNFSKLTSPFLGGS